MVLIFIPHLSLSRPHLLPSSQNTKLRHFSISLHATIMSWHRVQAYTEYSTHRVQHAQDHLFTLHPHDYESTPGCSCSIRHGSLHDRLASDNSPWEPKGKVTVSHSHVCESTDWWGESQHPAHRPSTASKYASNLTWLQPPRASPNSLDHSLQVHLHTRSITASKCISNYARLQPPSASLNSLDSGLGADLWVHLIMASKFISKYARLPPASASRNSHDYGLQEHLQTGSITASQCVSEYARSRPPSASLNSRNHGHRVYIWVHSIIIFRRTSTCSQGPPAASPDIPCVDG